MTAGIITSAAAANPAVRTPLRRWALTAGILWLVLAPVAFFLARSRHLGPAAAIPLALAFLTEISFYILPGFKDAVGVLRRLTRPRCAALLAAAALLPYLLLTLPQLSFSPVRFLTLAVIMTAVAGWFLIPEHPVRDIGFLLLLLAVLLSGVFNWIYPSPDPKTPAYVLGHLTLIGTAVLSVLVFDTGLETGDRMRFGFIPTPRELGIGVLWALPAAAVALPAGMALGILHLGGRPVPLWIAAGEVLGFFWMIALSEEFFFRALLQQWLTRWTGSAGIALIVASLAFGACHLYFGRQFPNVRFAILVAIVGFFYGEAYRRGGSMRASMVTHAILVSAWKLFLH